MKLLPLALAAFLALATTAIAQGILMPNPLTVPVGVDVTALRNAGKAAIAEVMASFTANQAANGNQSYIILPAPEDIDGDYFTLQFEDAFTQMAKGHFKLYTRTDEILAKVLKEKEFQDNFGDVMKPGTIRKLAFIGAQAVVLPRLYIDRSSDGTTTFFARISVHNVSSAEKVWGGESSKVVPGKLSTEQWITRGIIVLAAFAVLMIVLWFIRMVRRAARPR
jgi:hypothetical protein